MDGIGCLRGPVETIEVLHRDKKLRFFAVWVGVPGMPEDGLIGIRLLERNKWIWTMDLPKPGSDHFDKRIEFMAGD